MPARPRKRGGKRERERESFHSLSLSLPLFFKTKTSSARGVAWRANNDEGEKR
jgi:hypothetical protein